jgi:hypothetical protein
MLVAADAEFNEAGGKGIEKMKHKVTDRKMEA